MHDEIQKYEFKEGLKQQVEIIDMFMLRTEFSDEIKVPHRAEFYQILWFQSGTAIHMVDFNPIVIEPNTVLFINKNSVQQFDSRAEFNGKVLLFTDDFFCKTESDTKFLKSTILFNDLFEVSKVNGLNISFVLGELFRVLEEELEHVKDSLQSDILRHSLYNVLLYSERERRKQDFVEIKKGTDLDYVIIFKDLLLESFKEEKQVSTFVEKMNITSKRLGLATSKVLGKTPKELIDDQIMLEAKRLLAHTNNTVKEICFTLGFNEPTNFVKYFRKHSDLTPVEFRSKFLN